MSSTSNCHALSSILIFFARSLTHLVRRLRLEVSEFNMDGSEARPPYTPVANALSSFPRKAHRLRSLIMAKIGSSQERERTEDAGWGFASRSTCLARNTTLIMILIILSLVMVKIGPSQERGRIEISRFCMSSLCGLLSVSTQKANIVNVVE